MKTILFLIFLNIFFIQFSNAEDIKDYEIEGISIGDSALDHFTITELNKSLDVFYYTNKKYVYYFRESKENEKYKYIQFTVKNGDPKYIIKDIQGHIFYQNNIDKCFKDLSEIAKSLEDALNLKAQKDSGIHPMDVTGKSKYVRYSFFFDNQNTAEIICFDMSKEMEDKNKDDRLTLTLSTSEFNKFLRNEHYKK